MKNGKNGSVPGRVQEFVGMPTRCQWTGLGFPIARILGVFCLASGSLLTLAVGRYQGKETGELALLRQVADCLVPGDVVLGDRC